MAKEQKPLDVYERQCKDRLEKAGADLKTNKASGLAMKLAVFRWFADEQAVAGDERKALWEAWKSLPIWFGSNASQGRQRLWPDEKAEKIDVDIEP